MLPILMLAAQLVAKQQQEAEARRREVAHLAEERAARLGGNTMGVEAANFNRELGEQNYATPAQLMQLYGAIGSGDDKPTDGATSTTPGSDKLLDPWGPGNGGSRTDLIDPWSDDPYGSRRKF